VGEAADDRRDGTQGLAVTVALTGSDLTIPDVVRVARGGEPIALAPAARERIRRAREVVDAALARGDEVYGLSTGVGVHKLAAPDPPSLRDFNRRLLASHLVGQGPAYPAEVARAAMTRLVNGFARGTTGVSIELAERIVTALNDGEAPAIRMLGSVGEADLPANADFAVRLGLEPEVGEGLALLDHNAVSTGHAALALADAQRLADWLDVSGALDLEAFAANLSLLAAEIAAARPFPGLRASLSRQRMLLAGSYLWDEGAARNLQDPLSFRTLPQLHGALRDALEFATRQVTIDLNASQENPLVLAETGRVVAVGNFDALPISAALDFARIALAPVLDAGCERTVKLLQSSLTGLPDGLAPEPGLAESALSELGVPAQALAAEARLLAQPVSVEPGSATHHGGIEDRITLAPLSARRLAEQVSLGERLVAIELVVAAQAVDLRDRPRLGEVTGEAFRRVRELVPATDAHDAPPDAELLLELVRGPAPTGEAATSGS
jgi:histidine ammonia-lyase